MHCAYALRICIAHMHAHMHCAYASRICIAHMHRAYVAAVVGGGKVRSCLFYNDICAYALRVCIAHNDSKKLTQDRYGDMLGKSAFQRSKIDELLEKVHFKGVKLIMRRKKHQFLSFPQVRSLKLHENHRIISAHMIAHMHCA